MIVDKAKGKHASWAQRSRYIIYVWPYHPIFLKRPWRTPQMKIIKRLLKIFQMYIGKPWCLWQNVLWINETKLELFVKSYYLICSEIKKIEDCGGVLFLLGTVLLFKLTFFIHIEKYYIFLYCKLTHIWQVL